MVTRRASRWALWSTAPAAAAVAVRDDAAASAASRSAASLRHRDAGPPSCLTSEWDQRRSNNSNNSSSNNNHNRNRCDKDHTVKRAGMSRRRPNRWPGWLTPAYSCSSMLVCVCVLVCACVRVCASRRSAGSQRPSFPDLRLPSHSLVPLRKVSAAAAWRLVPGIVARAKMPRARPR